MTTSALASSLASAGAAAQQAALASGEITSRELTEHALAAIPRAQAELNAFTEVLTDEALSAADEADARLARGERAPLLGVPVAIKDDVEQAGHVTTWGSPAAGDVPAAADSELFVRLRAAGAVVVARTAAPELLIWPYTESERHGITRNPLDTSLTPGGSSGGSAAAVAAGVVGVAIGSDGGGSVRIPASCCGVFGLKTSRGLIPVAPHSDADHAWQGLGVYGPIGRTVADAALLLDAVAEPPAAGGTYADAAVADPGPLRIGVTVRTPLPGGLVDRDAKRLVRETADVLRALGHDVRDVGPTTPTAIPSFLVRFFTGIARSADALPHPELLSARSRRMQRIGHRLSGRPLSWARQAEAGVRARVDRSFADVDVLLTPALAGPPKAAGRMLGRGATLTLLDAAMWTPFSQVWNVIGYPAAAVPAGTAASGAPLSIQLAGRHGDDARLLAVCAQVERARPWLDRLPG